MGSPYEDGYAHGLHNDRECPLIPFTPSWFAWQFGNDMGVRVHCAMVEAIYLSEEA